MADYFRNIPSVDRLLSDERIQRLQERYSHELVRQTVRQHLDEVRVYIRQGEPAPSFVQLVDSVCNLVEDSLGATMRPVINATGVILHTNLGRAPLSKEGKAPMEGG